MSRKQIGFIGIIIIVGIVGAIYLINRMNVPAAFPAEEEILADLSKDSEDTEIQDKIQIDEETYFVPYVSQGDRYGKSIWKWLNRNWEMVSESEATGPYLLQGELKKYVYWNIHHRDEVAEFEVYMIRNRDYSLSYRDFENERAFYIPHFQVSFTVKTDDKSYGFAELPSDLEKTLKAIQTDQEISQELSFPYEFLYRWKALNADGKRTTMEETIRGQGGGSYSVNDVQFMSELNEQELE